MRYNHLTYKALELGCWRLAETAEPVSGGHSGGCSLQGELLEGSSDERGKLRGHNRVTKTQSVEGADKESERAYGCWRFSGFGG